MPPVDRPWAKLSPNPDGSLAALPLVEHGFDVAAAMEALLAGGGWSRALAHTAGRPLAGQDHARLVALTALHDLGKANSGFQARWDPRADKVGHEGQVAALLKDAVLARTLAAQALVEVLRDWGATAYLSALMAHHGRPREEYGPPPATGGRNRLWEKHVVHWRPKDGYDPAAEASRVIEAVRARFPLAWARSGTLPDAPRFVALFAGLVTLADWLGSDTARFPVEGPFGAAREATRVAQATEAVTVRGLTRLDTPAADFRATFEFEPRGIQAEAVAEDLGPVALIEAETGSGKTEAALWRWLHLRRRGLVDGLYFALPTRTAAVQLHARVQAMLTRLWGTEAPQAVLAVPGYLRAGDTDGQALPGWAVRWDDAGLDESRWAAERSNRFLAARVAVGTIDQALLGGLRIRHAPVRAAALARSLLVVDEVHASDAYMGRLLDRVLANHIGAGGHALLLSATLGAAARAQLLGQPVPTLAEAVSVPYPALSGRDAAPRRAAADGSANKRVSIEVVGRIDDPAAIAAVAVDAARAGASVLVVRNSVRGAVAVAQAVEALAPDLAFRVAGVATVHHGRFAADDRRLLDAEVERAFGKACNARGRVLVGTQTLEQSLDIDADLLVTDLAPMDVLLQRIGRLHRHQRGDRGAFADARAIVLRPSGRDLQPWLGPIGERHGLGPTANGGGVYPDLIQLEATLGLLEENPVVTIPADNRRLVERALHPQALDAIAAGLGTAWLNHRAACSTGAWSRAVTAADLSLDLATPFRDLVFPDGEEAVVTRLGARDLLIDLAPALPGPFGAGVDRLRIPHWMARGVGMASGPEVLGHDEDGVRFRLGEASFRYGRWGLDRL